MPEDIESTLKFEQPRRLLRRSKTIVEDMPPPKAEMLAEETLLPVSPLNIDTTPLPVSQPSAAHPVSVPQQQSSQAQPAKLGREAASAYVLIEECQKLCLSLFFREHAPVRSIGFTSSLNGEGKTFLAMAATNVLARDSTQPVILLECNWENPSLHQHFGFAPTPGLAEWLRGECSGTAICHRISGNLTVIPAGDGKRDAVTLLQPIRQRGLVNLLGHSNGSLVVDLPSIITTAYGTLAASLVESLIVVVRAGVTPDTMIAEACALVRDLPVHGLILNQVASRVPQWIRQLL
jgi:Mrp family chromosome partitioning ATPase